MDKDTVQIAAPQAPPIALNITPQGLAITFTLAPGLTLTQVLPEDVMNEITRRWVETRREVKRQMEIAQNVAHAGQDEAKRQMELIKSTMRKN